jgi:PAS domain S-box-containing protein
MGKKYDRYEMEIIVSLGALILFLISINFISGYSFENAKREQSAQFENSVNIAANFIKSELEKDVTRWKRSSFNLLERLRDLSMLTGIEDISVIDTTGIEIASLKSPETSSGSAQVLTVRRFLKGRTGRAGALLVVSATNKTGQRYGALSKWDTIFRAAGLLSALFIAFFFVRAVLNPYRRIKHEALDYNLDSDTVDSGKGIEYIVNTFKEVIRELEEKKSQLEVMYSNSEKRADSLARYNDYILGSISSGVVICDSSGNVTRFNRSAENILRYFERDCRGKHYREIFGAEHKLAFLLDDALERGVTHSRKEFEIRRPDGERLWLGCSSSMINDERGEGMGAVLLMIDLTEIRRLQELSSYSEKMASLGEMAAGLAHEIRNSFAAILGFARLIKKDRAIAEKEVSLVEAIRKESEAAETLLSKFLNFATPLDFQPETVDFRKLVSSILTSFSHPGPEKKNIKSRISNEVGLVCCDPILLKQALNNLLLNACDAMPDGGEILIEAKIENIGKRRPELAVSVFDNGIGIEPESLNKIFRPFHTDKPDGTGLGLALVKKIAVLHEGRIEVKSKPGKGTKFTIFLPLKTAGDNRILESDMEIVANGTS